MRAISTATSVVRHALGAFGEALLVALIIATLLLALAPVYRPADFLAGTGDAAAAKGGQGKGGHGGNRVGGTISLVVLDGSDETPNNGERVGFDVATTATDRPFIGLRCYQGAAFVLDGYTGSFDDYMFDPWITLDSLYWEAGVPADCTARLFYYDGRGRQKVLATLDFEAAP